MGKLTNEQIIKLREIGFEIPYKDERSGHDILFLKQIYGIGVDVETGEVFGKHGGKERVPWGTTAEGGRMCPPLWEMLGFLSEIFLRTREVIMPERAEEERNTAEVPTQATETAQEGTESADVTDLPTERIGAFRKEGNASYGNGALYLNQPAAELILEKVRAGNIFAIFSKDAAAIYLQVASEPAKNTVRLKEVENQSGTALRANGIKVLRNFFPEQTDVHVIQYTVTLLPDKKTLALTKRES